MLPTTFTSPEGRIYEFDVAIDGSSTTEFACRCGYPLARKTVMVAQRPDEDCLRSALRAWVCECPGCGRRAHGVTKAGAGCAQEIRRKFREKGLASEEPFGLDRLVRS